MGSAHGMDGGRQVEWSYATMRNERTFGPLDQLWAGDLAPAVQGRFEAIDQALVGQGKGGVEQQGVRIMDTTAERSEGTGGIGE